MSASLFVPLLAATVAACAQPAPPVDLPAPGDTVAFAVETVAENLDHPWSLAFLPGGDRLVTERPGRLRLIRDGQLVAEPIAGTPAVWARGQGGLLEVAPHPQFAENRLLYISYSKPSEDGRTATTALMRAKLDGMQLVDAQELFVAEAWSRAGQHFAGRIVFDGKGHLFLSVGDRGAPPSGDLERHPAQDPSNHQGTILRFNEDGSVPADNPFVGREGFRPEIWSYGHRNPPGLAMDAATGTLYDTEHGPRGGDELNRIEPGKNYGWPVITYGINYSGTPITEERTRPGMEQPLHYWVPSIATSGLVIYRGDAFPAWRGHALVGGLAGEQIAHVVLDGGKATATEVLLQKQLGRVRDLRTGPDGAVYVVVDTDGAGRSIVKLVPTR